MRRWGWPVAGVAVGMAIVLFGAQAAAGAQTRTLSYDAAALIAWDNDSGAQQQTTTHTSATGTQCADPVTIDKADGEGKGALLQFEGGMLFPVQLTDGAKVTRLRLFAVDQDANVDAYVYLVRKKLQTGVPKDAGYSVMATAHSTGNVLTNVRQFDDTTITGAIADPSQFAYYLELVSCGITVEPIGIQITMTTS
ncbi:MAG TPA: hypothetical protein VNN79_22225 [Actinomycetota bacterium]|nr:hypothetical protein [Actinomycetota bacterium]